MPHVSPAADRQGFVPVFDDRERSVAVRARAGKILTGDIQEQRGTCSSRPVEGRKRGTTRPVLKIQDGCNKRCSYCVIPQVRGRSRSLAPRTWSRNPQACEGGAREVVLSGIDLAITGEISRRTSSRRIG